MTEPGVPPPPQRRALDRAFDVAVWGGVAVMLAVSFLPAEVWKARLLVERAGNMGEYLAGFARPDFTHWGLLVEEMTITIQIAVWGTILAVVMGVVFGLLSSRNLFPWWVVQPARRLMDLFRAINEFVIAAIFIASVGLGPFPGVMALAVHTTGVLAKLFSEAVEAIDPGPVEGVRATGASRLEEIVWGIIPQVAPLWTSYALYRFEANARSATVLGFIGAGGIGQVLLESIRGFQYAQTAAIVIVIVVAVSLIDVLSQIIRRRLV